MVSGMPRTGLVRPRTDVRYDPWLELTRHWPEVAVRVTPLPGDLLGLVRYPVIVLRADTTAAQRRSTLTHEIVHLERGIEACSAASPFSGREEALVEAEAARRLIRLDDLAAAVRDLGPRPPPAALASALDVDGQLLSTRLAGLSDHEREWVASATVDDYWAA